MVMIITGVVMFIKNCFSCEIIEQQSFLVPVMHGVCCNVVEVLCCVL